MADNVELLTAHHLPYRVVNIIEEARESVVLVTAYLSSWPHLDHAIKGAIARGVRVSLVLRAPDGAQRDRAKREREAADLQELGACVHFVDRLHAKAYINESAAIVTSFNLVSGSNESIELGVLLQDAELVHDCIAKIRAYCPELAIGQVATARTPGKQSAPPARKEQAHCIGCAEPLPFDPARPFCLSCYRSSKKGSDVSALSRRVCHRCGAEGPATLDRPICPPCWKQIPKDEQAKITASLA